jgi:hypothetical protein
MYFIARVLRFVYDYCLRVCRCVSRRCVRARVLPICALVCDVVIYVRDRSWCVNLMMMDYFMSFHRLMPVAMLLSHIIAYSKHKVCIVKTSTTL